MRNILERSVDKLDSVQEGMLAYCWSGVFFDLEHKLVRADKTFLNVILRRPGAAKDESPMFLRCPPCICAGGCVGHEEPYVRYSLSTVFKVMCGERKGKVVPACEIRKDERYRDAGLKKWMRKGKTPDCFSAKRKGDQIVMELLQNFCTQKTIHTAKPLTTAPPYYTCRQATNKQVPRLRRDQETLEFLRGFGNYDTLLSSDQNAKALRDEIVMDVGAGQVAFPFTFFYGRGVLAADFSDIDRPFGIWYTVPMESFEQASTHIEFKN